MCICEQGPCLGWRLHPIALIPVAHCAPVQVVALVHTLFSVPALQLQRVLICAPVSVISNWVHEFNLWWPKQQTQPLHVYTVDQFTRKACSGVANVQLCLRPDCVSVAGVSTQTMGVPNAAGRGERAREISKWFHQGGVLVMGFEMFCRLVSPENAGPRLGHKLRKYLLRPGPDVLVVDEAHSLSNRKTQRATKINRVATRRRVLLTGTPLQNTLSE